MAHQSVSKPVVFWFIHMHIICLSDLFDNFFKGFKSSWDWEIEIIFIVIIGNVLLLSALLSIGVTDNLSTRVSV